MAARKGKDLISVTGPSPALTAAKAVAGALLVIAIAAALWYGRTAVLLGFAGVLLAVLFYAVSRWLAETTGLPRLAMLAAVVVLTVVILVFAIWQAGPGLAEQITDLTKTAAVGLTNLTKQIVDITDQQNLLEELNVVDILSRLSPWNIATGATAMAGSVLGALTAGLIVLFFGIYLAADPETYVRLAARLAPKDRRGSTYEMMCEMGDVLQRWLVGQGLAMAAIGTVTYIGLLILGVPLAFLLALFAGLAGFLPYIGPVIGAVPIVLVAGGESLTLALYAIGLYIIVQLVESYLITPLIQARAVSLPPAIVILNQLLFGFLFGVLGIALATPIAAAASVPLGRIFEPAREPTKSEMDIA